MLRVDVVIKFGFLWMTKSYLKKYLFGQADSQENLTKKRTLPHTIYKQEPVSKLVFYAQSTSAVIKQELPDC